MILQRLSDYLKRIKSYVFQRTELSDRSVKYGLTALFFTLVLLVTVLSYSLAYEVDAKKLLKSKVKELLIALEHSNVKPVHPQGTALYYKTPKMLESHTLRKTETCFSLLYVNYRIMRFVHDMTFLILVLPLCVLTLVNSKVNSKFLDTTVQKFYHLLFRNEKQVNGPVVPVTLAANEPSEPSEPRNAGKESAPKSHKVQPIQRGEEPKEKAPSDKDNDTAPETSENQPHKPTEPARPETSENQPQNEHQVHECCSGPSHGHGEGFTLDLRQCSLFRLFEMKVNLRHPSQLLIPVVTEGLNFTFVSAVFLLSLVIVMASSCFIYVFTVLKSLKNSLMDCYLRSFNEKPKNDKESFEPDFTKFLSEYIEYNRRRVRALRSHLCTVNFYGEVIYTQNTSSVQKQALYRNFCLCSKFVLCSYFNNSSRIREEFYKQYENLMTINMMTSQSEEEFLPLSLGLLMNHLVYLVSKESQEYLPVYVTPEILRKTYYKLTKERLSEQTMTKELQKIPNFTPFYLQMSHYSGPYYSLSEYSELIKDTLIWNAFKPIQYESKDVIERRELSGIPMKERLMGYQVFPFRIFEPTSEETQENLRKLEEEIEQEKKE